MTVGILAEKASAARNFSSALGGASGSFNGENYRIFAASGHLYEFADPSLMVPASKSSTYKAWSMQALPWTHTDFSWKLVPRKDGKGSKGYTQSVIDKLKDLNKCDEIVIATDVDPSGEGDLIAWEIISQLGLEHKRISRMFFVDETPDSVRSAFADRKPIGPKENDPAYKKATYRSRFDLLSMQWTRVASLACAERGTTLRQGRLKSAMITLVGDGIKAYKDYKPTPFFEPRFKDDNGVVYSDKDVERMDVASKVDLSKFHRSAVVKDEVKKGRTAPQKLLDLATLSSRLVMKGEDANRVLKVYQSMYERHLVSYPRTEDKTVTNEQFNELLPKIDQIARVVGVDPSVLTHRTPRKTHVKDMGAHGANRPGMVVPASLDAIRQDFGELGVTIYTTVARSYLAMCAEDHEFETHKGHIADFPSFVGSIRIPLVAGWKAVIAADFRDDDEEESTIKGLGSMAEPFVHEGVPPRPPHPTMKWLMAQLEKHDVGTPATRVSTYVEVSNPKVMCPSLKATKGKLTLTKYGQRSWFLLKDTIIGDLKTTEHVYKVMRDIAEGKTTCDAELPDVAQWITSDIETMTKNAVTMRKELDMGEPAAVAEYVDYVTEDGEEARFKRTWASHRFTDEEVERLRRHEVITFEYTSAKGATQIARGKILKQEFNGKTFYGFGFFGIPAAAYGVTFTDAELKALEAGQAVERDDFYSPKKKKNYSAKVVWDAKEQMLKLKFD